MIPEFAYFLKVNIAFALFFAFYRLFFYKDTFFKLRRSMLLAFFGLAFAYPLLDMQEWIREQPSIVEAAHLYATWLPDVIVRADPAAVDWEQTIYKGLLGIYIGGVTALSIRFLVQLGSILWLAYHCRRESVGGVPVYRMPKPCGPFSFFRMIFIYPESHMEKELEEILVHEQTHVSQWHSIDVIISEWVTILCWINPFVWLLKREVRHNLEYLADHRVIQSGYDSKSYQYHLLGLAHHHQAAANLYNSFNVLHLKNRISMMNKKRSRGIGRTKCLVFLPLVVALMLLSNMEVIARISTRLTETETNRQPVIGAIEQKGNQSKAGKAGNREVAIEDNSDPSNPIYRVAEQMPRFPGGDEALLQFLARELKYPKEAQEQKLEGRVICIFVVNKDGSVTDAKILRGIHPLLDAEALRVVNSFPKWEPGTVGGKAVRVIYTVPIAFHL